MTDAPSPRATVKRLPRRAAYDRETIASILREGLVCHVAIADGGQPFALPMAYGFDGEALYLHGSPASRLMRAVADGRPLCATVTLLDALVVARSAFHHSLNYRSVVVLGAAREVCEPGAKLAALETLVEHVLPGRWAEARRPSEKELRATLVARLPVDEASAKIRSGPPVDDVEDLALPIWAGLVPLALQCAEPLPAADLAPGLELPESLRAASATLLRRRTRPQQRPGASPEDGD